MRPYPRKTYRTIKGSSITGLQGLGNAIENIFGIHAARWRILRTSINGNVSNVDHIVKAAVALHNFCQTELQNLYCPSDYIDSADTNKDLYCLNNYYYY